MNSLRQRFNTMVRPQGQVFYGWWIVAAAGGVQYLASVLWMQSYGAYVVLLQSDFGWSKTVLAGAFALTRVESGLLGPLQGWLVDRFGPRPILQIGTLLFGLGFVLFSQVNSLLTFYLSFALIALGSSLGGFATLMVSLVNWFSRYRATAVSISQVGYALGGFSVPLVILLLEAFGWRTTALISGVLVVLVGMPLVQVVRHRPGEIGLLPDGAVPKPREAHEPHPLNLDFTARQAMRTAAFWLISAGHAVSLLTVSAVMVHLVPHLTEGLGFTLPMAGIAIALMTGFQMTGQLLGGYLGDRMNKRIVCALCMVAHAVGLALVTFATNWGMVVAFAALHGLAWGVRGPLMVALRADYFGPSSFGTIMGFSSLIVMFGMSGGPLIAGYMADVSGNYESGLALLAFCALLGSVLFLMATPPARPAPARAQRA
ncbi:MAG: MFS transporter [Pseudomonadales bacterium]